MLFGLELTSGQSELYSTRNAAGSMYWTEAVRQLGAHRTVVFDPSGIAPDWVDEWVMLERRALDWSLFEALGRTRDLDMLMGFAPEILDADLGVGGINGWVDRSNPTSEDREWIECCLARRLTTPCVVVCRDVLGRPAVVQNAPQSANGTPMPTRYWLIQPDWCRQVGALESRGCIDAIEAEIGLERIDRVHRAAAVERRLSWEPGRGGRQPEAGVGGTRVGVKCLHAHLAWHLAGGEDPVGHWVAEQIGLTNVCCR